MNEPAGVLDSGYADRRAKNKALRYRYRTRAKVAVDEFRRRCPDLPRPRVLDLGAAEGKTLIAMRSMLGEQGTYDGVEFTSGLVEAGNASAPDGVRIIEGDAMNLSSEFQEGSYDLVTVLAVLEHLPDPEKCLGEAKRMLRPGGVLVVTCPNPFWDDVAARLGLLHAGGDHHEQDFSLDDLAALVTRCGFTDPSRHRFMWAPVGFLPYVGIEPSASFAVSSDRLIERLRLFNFGFVNQVVAATRV